MFVLTVLGIVGAIALIIWSFYAFNEHCDYKFGYRFFTFKAFLTIGVSILLCYWGALWSMDAHKIGGDVLNGILVAAIGVIAALVLIYFNFSNTNIAYGIGGSLVQFSVFAVALPFGIMFFFLWLVIAMLANEGVQHIRVVN